MTDLAFVAILIAFFGVARLFVAACERIIGPDVELATVEPAGRPGDAHEEQAA